MAKIWRASFTDRRVVNLILVEADELEKLGKARQFASLAQQVLDMPNCQDCWKEWPFESTLGLNELLQQVEDGWEKSHATYFSQRFQTAELHAVGLGSNKKGRWRAGLLALALGGLLADSSLDVPKELSEYLQLAREQSIKQLQLCPGKLDTCGKLEEGRGPKECKDWIEEEDWLPESGSWVWWLDQQTLAVLCEDLGAQVFAGAKQWLLEAMGGADCTEEDGKAAFGWQIKKVFPDIFWYPTLFKHQESNYQVVGIGRDIDHRRRAAYLGFAALSGHHYEEGLRRLVVEEVWGSCWFPQHRIDRFYDVDSCGFWLNMQMWKKGHENQQPFFEEHMKQVGMPIAEKALKDIRMNCQPALLEELKRHGRSYAEIDLTKTGYPWPKVLAGHEEGRCIVGEGVERIAIVADKETPRDAYQTTELIHFVVWSVDGQRHSFDCLKRTHKTKWERRTPKDETLAFRLAAGWQVKKRWEAYIPNVFQNLIRLFKESVRPEGLDDADWQQPSHKSDLHAWTLSGELVSKFNDWLDKKTVRCEALEELQHESLDETVEGLCRACDGNLQNDSNLGKNREDQSAPSMQRFSPLQKLLLDEVLKGDSHLLKQLDPSRCQHSEWWWEWHSADEDIRFSHENVSRTFLHGHPGLALSDLIGQLVGNPRDSESIPALVAVKRKGVLHVIMGNRRLFCYKEALKKGRNCFFKVIVHEFPDCRGISDPASRNAFKLKVIQAMSTENHGQEVDFHTSKQCKFYR